MTTPNVPSAHRRVLAVLSGLTCLGILLQGVWAGIFLSSDNRPDSWVHIHDMGAWITLALAVLTAGWAVLKLREERRLLIGSILLPILIAGEAHIGGMITDNGADSLTAVHVPLAMALLGLAVWIPFRATHPRRVETLPAHSVSERSEEQRRTVSVH